MLRHDLLRGIRATATLIEKTKDVDVSIPDGKKILMFLGAANRSPHVSRLELAGPVRGQHDTILRAWASIPLSLRKAS